ncbi:MAG: Hpt domain-containing protein [Pseudomonadota bacterium]
MPQQILVDLDRITELEEEFGVEDMAFVVDAFFEEADEALPGLENMLSSQPDQERAAVFHFLAGSAAMVGAAQFAGRCKDLEMTNTGFSRAELDDLMAQYNAVRGWFEERFSGTASNAA